MSFAPKQTYCVSGKTCYGTYVIYRVLLLFTLGSSCHIKMTQSTRHSFEAFFWGIRVLKIAFQLLNDHIGFYSCNVEATFLFEVFFEHENTTEIRQIVVANSRTLLSHQRAIINFELKLNCNPLLWNFHSILEVSSWESCYFQIITLPKSYVSS